MLIFEEIFLHSQAAESPLQPSTNEQRLPPHKPKHGAWRADDGDESGSQPVRVRFLALNQKQICGVIKRNGDAKLAAMPLIYSIYFTFMQILIYERNYITLGTRQINVQLIK